ncbi:MAG: ATP-binding cassette domain-containing protein [Candidatus Hydrogenedentes bacterium]|nr:ATP-binding cassette domain-containing protein [Candidatus Hydrogenedentota bacterium]
MTAPILSLNGISKAFGGVPAVRSVSVELRPGEVHGLVGENGAGKSTIINIASGVLRPDSGEIVLDGHAIHIAGPMHASALGIAVVHQEADLFPQLSIAENMLLGRGLKRGAAGLIRWTDTYAEAQQRVATMGESFDVRAMAAGLPVTRRMMAEIAASVADQARVLFLDEPTASLTQNEIQHLFERIRQLRDAGVAIVYVSHRLEEVLHICDCVTVMRDGETVATEPASELSIAKLVSLMVGRELSELYEKEAAPMGAVRLSVEHATDGNGVFQDVSLDVRAGEIVGVYGFVGAGRSEFAQALFGLGKLAAGAVAVDGKPFRPRSSRHAVNSGLAYLPEDRLVQGVFRGHSVRSNASVAVLRRLSTAGIVSAKREQDLADRVVREMNVRTNSTEQPIVTLSGGNQQKVVFGRWSATEPSVLLLDEPTRGVDVGAKAEIHKLMGELAARGAAVLMISSELPEIMAMSDRVITFSEGRKTGEFDPKHDDEKVIAAAAVPRQVKEPVVRDSRASRAANYVLRFRETGLLAFILLLSLGMAAWKPHEFATVNNFFDVLADAALPAILALGAMLIICAGGIDISVGSMMGLVGAMAGLAANAGYHPLVCLAIAMAAGCAFSLLNGGVSLVARIHPIIVTLAGISIYRGLQLKLTGGREVLDLPAAYRVFARGDFLGIPKICFYAVIATALIHVLLRYTLTGRRILALGNSESAARLIGLSKTRLTLFVFGVSGILIGLTAVLHAGYYGGVQSDTGKGWELRAIAAAVIGGTNILGGRGSAIGTLLGAFLMALVYNILVLARASSYWQNVFVGGLILAAVLIDLMLLQRRGSRA